MDIRNEMAASKRKLKVDSSSTQVDDADDGGFVKKSNYKKYSYNKYGDEEVGSDEEVEDERVSDVEGNDGEGDSDKEDEADESNESEEVVKDVKTKVVKGKKKFVFWTSLDVDGTLLECKIQEFKTKDGCELVKVRDKRDATYRTLYTEEGKEVEHERDNVAEYKEGLLQLGLIGGGWLAMVFNRRWKPENERMAKIALIMDQHGEIFLLDLMSRRV
nr:hypothetical protein [Tanacetum cinerariifolium]